MRALLRVVWWIGFPVWLIYFENRGGEQRGERKRKKEKEKEREREKERKRESTSAICCHVDIDTRAGWLPFVFVRKRKKGERRERTSYIEPCESKA